MDAGRRDFVRGCGGLLGAAALRVGPGRAQPSADVTAVATGTRLGDDPTTRRLAPEASAGRVVVLSIEGIEGRSVQPVRLNVFVDKPAADHATPTTDPSFVGSIQLMPRQGAIRRIGAVLDLTDVVARRPGGPVAVTLVPVIGTANDRPTGVDLTVERMSIRSEAN